MSFHSMKSKSTQHSFTPISISTLPTSHPSTRFQASLDPCFPTCQSTGAFNLLSLLYWCLQYPSWGRRKKYFHTFLGKKLNLNGSHKWNVAFQNSSKTAVETSTKKRKHQQYPLLFNNELKYTNYPNFQYTGSRQDFHLIIGLPDLNIPMKEDTSSVTFEQNAKRYKSLKINYRRCIC